MSLLAKAIANSHKCYANKDAFLQFVAGKIHRVKVGPLEFVFHFYEESVAKDNRSTNPPTVTRRDPLMPPYEPYIKLEHWKAPCEHYVILNRYMFCPGHMIMPLDSQREMQGSMLKKHDFECLSRVIQSVDDKGVAYYNGGVDAGCTQYHKHMQYVPCREHSVFDAMARNYRLPYKYFTEKLPDYRASTIGDAYMRLFERAQHEGSYNFLLSGKVAALVPRSQARHKTGCLVNSMGVCGHLFVTDNNYKQAEADPLKLLTDVCVRIE